MSDQPEELEHRERKRFGAGCFAVVCVSILLVYPLSVPFLLVLVVHGILPNSVYSTIYAPLANLAEHVEAVDDFFEWYVSLFPDSWFNFP